MTVNYKLFLLGLIASSLLNFTQAQLPFTVEEMADLPESVSNNAVCEGFVNGEAFVYSFSGIDSSLEQSGIHLKAWKYSTSLNAWELIDTLPDVQGKIAASANRIGDIIYIMGGYYVAPNGSETSSTKVHRFHTPSNTFLTDGAPIPVAIDDHVQAVWRDSLIYLVTGWSNTTNVPNVQIYNPSEDSWQVGTAVPNNNLYKVFGASGTIVGDTIYYYGGASLGFNFPATFQLRKGVIDPNDPSQISWNIDTLDSNLFGYRPAALEISDTLFFVGGSEVSYNYDAVAYNGSGVVAPSSQIIVSSTNNEFQIDSSLTIPMDLRSVAKTASNEFYIVGGIGENAVQSKKLLKITWRKQSPVGIKDQLNSSINIFPNPANSWIQVRDDKKDILAIHLLDLQGKILLTEKESLVLDINDLNTGIYLIKVETSEGVFAKKIVIN